MGKEKKEGFFSKVWSYTQALFRVILFSTGIVACMDVSGVIVIPGTSLLIWIVGCFLAWFLPMLIFFKKPVNALIAGITNALIPVFAFVYFHLIFGDRSSVIKFELAIPVLLAYGLGYGVYVGFKKLFPKNEQASQEAEVES